MKRLATHWLAPNFLAARLLAPWFLGFPMSEAPAQASSKEENEEQTLRRAFDGYDVDKDGKVSEKEFPGDPEMFAAMDKNRDRITTFGEFKNSAFARRLLDALREDRDAPRRRQRSSCSAARRPRPAATSVAP